MRGQVVVRPVRVLVASADYVPDGGGIGAYAHGIYWGLRRLGCQCHVLSVVTGARRPSGEEIFLPVAGERSRLAKLRALWNWRWSLRSEIRRWECDWLLIPTWDPVAIALTQPWRLKLRGVRIAVVFHGADVASADWRKRVLLRRVLRAADCIIANSGYTRGLLGSRFGARAEVLHPGIHESDLCLPPAPRSIAKLISVGRLVKRKGHALVIEAVARLSGKYPGLNYTIVGSGPEQGPLMEMVARLKIGSRVRFLGHVPLEVKKRELATATLFALPVIPDEADPEGFGIVFLEAGATGLPVLTTAAGGVTECVMDGLNGLVCEPTAGGVTEGVSTLLASEDLRKRLGEGGREVARRSLWPARAAELLWILSECPAAESND